MAWKISHEFKLSGIGSECPICESQLEDFDLECAENNGECEHTFTCERCNLFVIFTSPNGNEYHAFADSQITISFEPMI